MKIRKLNDSNSKDHRRHGWIDVGITRSFAVVRLSLWDWIFGGKTIRKHLRRGSLQKVRSNDYRLCPIDGGNRDR